MDTTPTPHEHETEPVHMPNPVKPTPPQTFISQASPLVISNESDSANSAVTIVWQWVTYGLWEWALIALAILLSSTLSYFFDNANGSRSYAFDIYVLAAMVCLLPLAIASNHIYFKKEATQKHDFSAVIMVLNAVGVFLATIGALITLVVSILSLFTSASPSTSINIIITSSLIVTILGVMLFIRIINPAPLAWFTKIFPYLVLGVAGVAVVLALIGPFRSEVVNRQDVMIESNLTAVNDAIQNYESKNNSLPNSLSDIDLSGQPAPQQLVSSGLVTYTVLSNTSVVKKTGTSTSTSNANGTFVTMPETTTVTKDKYKLCVTFKSAKTGPGPTVLPAYSTVTDDSAKLNQISLMHPAGNVCYTLTAPLY